MLKRNVSNLVSEYSGVLLGFLLVVGVWYALNKEPRQQIPVNKHIVVVNISGYYFQQAIDTLKKYEGFRSDTYLCSAGKRTIGYGHRNREGYASISTSLADSILREDLGYYVGRASSKTGLIGNKALAIGLMMFAMGESGFCNTRLYQRIVSGDVSRLNWTDYCRINGKENARKKKQLKFVEWLFNQK